MISTSTGVSSIRTSHCVSISNHFTSRLLMISTSTGVSSIRTSPARKPYLSVTLLTTLPSPSPTSLPSLISSWWKFSWLPSWLPSKLLPSILLPSKLLPSKWWSSPSSGFSRLFTPCSKLTSRVAWRFSSTLSTWSTNCQPSSPSLLLCIRPKHLRSLLRTRGLLSFESSTATACTPATGIIFEVEVLVLLVREVGVVGLCRCSSSSSSIVVVVILLFSTSSTSIPSPATRPRSSCLGVSGSECWRPNQVGLPL